MVYHEELFEPLITTLVRLCTATGCTVVLAQQRRFKVEERFYRMARKVRPRPCTHRHRRAV